MEYNMKDEVRHTLVFNTMKGIGKLSNLPEDKYLKLGDLYNYASMFVSKTIHDENYNEKEIELLGTIQEYIDSYIALIQSNYFTLLSIRGNEVSLFYLSRIYQILFILQSIKDMAIPSSNVTEELEKFSFLMRQGLSEGMVLDLDVMVIQPFILEIALSDLYYKTAHNKGYSYKEFYNIPFFQNEFIKRLNPKMIRTIQEKEKEMLQKKSRFFLDFYEKMKKIEKRLDEEMLWVHGIFSYKLEALLKILLGKKNIIDSESCIIVIDSLLDILIKSVDTFDRTKFEWFERDSGPYTYIWTDRLNLLSAVISLL